MIAPPTHAPGAGDSSNKTYASIAIHGNFRKSIGMTTLASASRSAWANK